jgi:hypothetical protein
LLANGETNTDFDVPEGEFGEKLKSAFAEGETLTVIVARTLGNLKL